MKEEKCVCGGRGGLDGRWEAWEVRCLLSFPPFPVFDLVFTSEKFLKKNLSKGVAKATRLVSILDLFSFF